MVLSVDGDWGAWGSWADCSQTCGISTRTRERKCDNPPPTSGGLECQGDATDYENCTGVVCPGI